MTAGSSRQIPIASKRVIFRSTPTWRQIRPIAAEKGTQKIVVEVKSFVGHSLINDLYEALGQYLIYLRLLETTESDRKLWLAVSDLVFYDFFQVEAIQDVVKKYGVDLLVVNIESEEVEQWIS